MIGTPAQLRVVSTVNTVAVADANLTFSVKTEITRCNHRFQAVV